ncbi:E3 ubiquitin-protein ligase TRIM37-like [Sabethes cyaneus]|uniref:E3 ubiquitin-protein ligase TRIM37-like n=1 Tax=Sabethes cyaneus TaxID=53552 RepID=UPI00237E9AB3|nr:E3 ubiquitin-protein ligase TRIM37-like [Sabethes cyaneus]
MEHDLAPEGMTYFECCICQQALKDTQLCPRCCKMFCNKCILEWFEKEESCPCCRAAINKASLVKGRPFEEMQKMFENFHILDERNRCSRHKTRELSLFCYVCEESICTHCWNAEPHLEHKDQAVPVDEACNKFQEQLEKDLLWVNERNAAIDRSLRQIEDHEDQLANKCKIALKKLEKMKQTAEAKYQEQLQMQRKAKDVLQNSKEQTDNLSNMWSALLKAENNANALHQLMEARKTADSLRLEQDPCEKVVKPLYISDVLPEMTTLSFHFVQFDEVIAKHKFYEAQQNCRGFQWMLRLEKEDENVRCLLCLMKGENGEYAIVLEDEPQEYFVIEEHGESVELGQINPTVGSDGSVTVRVHIQQAKTFREMCTQFDKHVEQLEKENNENKSILRALADWQSKNSS